MASTESKYVTKDVLSERQMRCDERYEDTKGRLKEAEAALDRASQNLERSAVILNQIAESQKDHEKRLRSLEARGGQWLDKIIAVALGAVVAAFVAYITTGGKVN